MQAAKVHTRVQSTGCVGNAVRGEEFGSGMPRTRIRHSILSRWRRQSIEHAPQVFKRGKAQNQSQERMIGQLTTELEGLKKVSLLLRSPQRGNGRWLPC